MRCLRSHGKYQHQKQFYTERKESLSVLLNYTVLINEQLKMHEDEDLDCKVLSVMMRHFKKCLQIFFF